MSRVHIYISTGQFRSFAAMRKFVEPTYTPDGDALASEFCRQIELSNFEPMCIECVHSKKVKSVRDLTRDASYSYQWLQHLEANLTCDAAILVYSPNTVRKPRGSSLTYCGGFDYDE